MCNYVSLDCTINEEETDGSLPSNKYSKTSNVLTANDRRITRCLSDTRRAHEREPRVAAPDPYQLVRGDLHALYSDIQTELGTEHDELHQLANYYLLGEGKAFRPMIACLMATACNIHTGTSDSCLASQRCIAMIAEMIHSASLVHDDVIDRADKRRSKPSINKLWGQRKAVLTGDFILSQASIALARIGNEQVVILLSQVLEDLVKGEFMQLGTKENENQRFAHYLDKTYKKTASLIANSCRAVAVLSDAHEDVQEVAYQYGRNLGIAFQVSSSSVV
ncbi:PREDICTED: decaprenyl-diphosphate synthase subunit 1-like isoform X2 [Priapulus caudatus]|uniref:Decaprenyl-diphosphate synthase subunit 1-like isoform X2 n=1 Tax=Priapulus caudatus TaxID=37621 RepID=A0ABM1EHI5_PRICU|nr:PREDICTED: decaprenyl-diphosphate synthase subunit 1-like isoform X2 [Priapulus caudatus]